ncbi:hypothetical protein BD560DRAFT_365320 [Blakeslea trispora]|nr:hypothetical protein BD560DRAFT_365320 [Blakeslea trispora]
MSRSLLILYGSETGCAQDVAENLARQARRRHFHARTMAMDDYDKARLIEEKLVIFVCSTTGQGAEPTNMRQFWKFLLRKNLPRDILSDIDCAVLGLGDSSYRKFNYPSKKLYKRLIQLGANMLIDRGDGDDQHYLGLDGAFIPWAKQLWEVVMQKYPTDQPVIPDDVLLPPNYKLTFLTDDPQEPHQPYQTLPGEVNLVVKENKRITAEDHFQDVRHIELVCEKDPSELDYQPGDIAVIRPQNLPVEVDGFLELMGWTDKADKYIQLTTTDPHQSLPSHWPTRMRFKDLFLYHLDIFGVPRRSFFEMLSYFTPDQNLKERLQEFSSPQGQEDMWNYCMRPRRHVAEILFDFQPLDIPLDYIVDLFPLLQPRSFSIASSLDAHPATMELCVAIVKYKTKLKRVRRGVFTKWLATWQPGDQIRSIRIERGTMTLPPSPEIPLIAIGPGTGVAPMKSFIEHRIAQGAKRNVLLFGCRYPDKDYYYQEQWHSYEAQNQLSVWTAFSRQDPNRKCYVQDRIREHAGEVWDLIEYQQAKVVLSGSLDKMPEDVAYAFKQVFMQQGGLDAEEAENYYRDMVKTGQYQEECWN